MNGAKVKQAVGRGGHMVLRPRRTNEPPPDAVVYQMTETMTLPPGRYQLRASVSSAKLSDGGSVYLAIDVPDFREPRIALSHLVLGYAGGPRVPTYSAPPPASRGRGRGPLPPAAIRAAAAITPFPPTLDREFTTADDVALYFEITRRDRARALQVDVAVIGEGDHLHRRYAQTLPADHHGRVSFGLPLSQIGPGVFTLKVTASDGVNETTQEIAIIIGA